VRNFEIPLEFFNQNQVQSFHYFRQKSFFSKNIFKIIQIASFLCCLGFGFILGYSYIFFINFFEEHLHLKNSIFHFAPCFKQPLFPLSIFPFSKLLCVRFKAFFYEKNCHLRKKSKRVARNQDSAM
jgi:hypothetical protein